MMRDIGSMIIYAWLLTYAQAFKGMMTTSLSMNLAHPQTTI